MPDLIDGLFELLGSVLLWMNVRKLRHDKMVRGVHWGPTTFFFVWGVWNLYYYPFLGQWLSFLGGLSIMVANLTWLILMLKYRKN